MVEMPDQVVDFIHEHHVMGQPGTVGCFGVVMEKEGVRYPNLSPRNFLVGEDGSLVCLDLYSEWMQDVLSEKQQVSCVFVDEDQLQGYIIRGMGEYHTSGTQYEEAANRVRDMGWPPLRGIIRIEPMEVRIADLSKDGGQILVSEGTMATAGGQ